MGFLDLLSRISGYVRHRPFRTNHERIDAPASFEGLDDAKRAAYAEANGDRVLEEYAEFTIGHVEFDDQGAFWEPGHSGTEAGEADTKPGQLDTIEAYFRDELDGEAALVLVFVHGWKHNAKHDDGNLVSFRAVLSNLAETEAKLAQVFEHRARKIVGIYASWRGLSNRHPVLRELTFWQRKKTAHTVGRGSLLETLVRIEQLRYVLLHEDLSSLIVIGHSFGGAAVYSAVSPYIKTNALEIWHESKLRPDAIAPIRGFGDSVILVNPAFEAMLYDDFDRLTRGIHLYDVGQHVVLMTVSADNDGATKWAFPIGQTLGRWLQRRQAHQWPKITKTSGNYDDYITHVLGPADDAAREGNTAADLADAGLQPWQKPAPLQGPAADERWMALTPPDKRWAIDAAPKRHLPVGHAFMMVRAEQKLIDGHNGIFTTLFMEYVRDFVIAQDLRRATIEAELEKDEPGDVEMRMKG